MKKLIVISADLYVRNFIQSGAFSEIEDNDTYYITWDNVKHSSELKQKNYLGSFGKAYAGRNALIKLAQKLLLYGNLDKSDTFRLKCSLEPKFLRVLYGTIGSIPVLRDPLIWLLLNLRGVHKKLYRTIKDLNPDLVIIPSSSFEFMVTEVLMICKKLGIPTLDLINGWDNLSSKIVYPIKPDYLCVWGGQSVEDAQRIHDIPKENVFITGAAQLDHYFHLNKESLISPYAFDYVLFAGCEAPFDEMSALKTLDNAIEKLGIQNFKILYRPHPWKRPRKCFDEFREGDFKHVILDKQVKEAYAASKISVLKARSILPSLDYYPSLLHNSKFVICPLSTMTLESAIFEKPVLVIAYDDRIHEWNPKFISQFNHFKGMDKLDGIHMCREMSDFEKIFVSMCKDSVSSDTKKKKSRVQEQIKQFVYYDDRTYAQRLKDVVKKIGYRPPGRSMRASRP